MIHSISINFRYEKELSRTRWNSIRKGAAFGIYVGWLFFVTYIIYALGFLSGSFLISYNDQSRFNISDILVVSSSSKKSTEKKFNEISHC